jgi:hypothetical protein
VPSQLDLLRHRGDANSEWLRSVGWEDCWNGDR